MASLRMLWARFDRTPTLEYTIEHTPKDEYVTPDEGDKRPANLPPRKTKKRAKKNG